MKESFRRQQLEQLYKLIDENQDEITKAIQSDMKGRPSNEIQLTEISSVKSEIAHQINHLTQYMTPKKVPSSAFLTDSGHIHYTPLGNVLIISPWNFPFNSYFVHWPDYCCWMYCNRPLRCYHDNCNLYPCTIYIIYRSEVAE